MELPENEAELKRKAERATWLIFADVIAEVVGFDTALHRLATEAARTGDRRDVDRMMRGCARLDPAMRHKVETELKRLYAKRNEIALNLVKSGRV